MQISVDLKPGGRIGRIQQIQRLTKLVKVPLSSVKQGTGPGIVWICGQAHLGNPFDLKPEPV
jgi:hypothetical protein